MKSLLGRNKLLLWVAISLLVVVAVIWSWSRLAEFSFYKQLHDTLTKQVSEITPALSDAGFEATTYNPKSCVHPWGDSPWLADINCQVIVHLKTKQTLEAAQKSYEADPAKLDTALGSRGWSKSDASDLVAYTKAADGAKCLIIIDFTYGASVAECEKSVKVPVLPLPYFYEYYGGG